MLTSGARVAACCRGSFWNYELVEWYVPSKYRHMQFDVIFVIIIIITAAIIIIIIIIVP